MVYSSVPVYLDPRNWQQEEPNPQRSSDQTIPLPPFPSPPLHTPQPHPADGGAGLATGQLRPNSMAERARAAKIALPEAPLKCPRCESTNTKFCYFNNYSLSQPRHFCKTCRRYWTRGGALRNVPVGGGCRKNRRTKSNNSGHSNSNRLKSTVLMPDQQASISSSTAALSAHAHLNTDPSNLTICQIPSLGPHLPLLPPLQNLSDQYNLRNMGISFGGIDHHHISTTNTSTVGVADQWRSLQQFPFLTGSNSLEQSSTGFYSLIDSNGVGSNLNQPTSKPSLNTATPACGTSNLVSEVKAEENEQGMSSMPRNLLGNFNVLGNDQFWGGNGAWSNHDQYPADFRSNSSTDHLS